MSGAERTVGLPVKWAFLLGTAISDISISISSERLIGFSNGLVAQTFLNSTRRYIVEREQIAKICMTASDKSYIVFLSNEGWKYDTEDAAIAGYERLKKARRDCYCLRRSFWKKCPRWTMMQLRNSCTTDCGLWWRRVSSHPRYFTNMPNINGAEIVRRLSSFIRPGLKAGR